MSVSVRSRHPSHKNFEFPLFNKTVRIFFGSTTEGLTPRDIEFPSRESIINCSNKMKMKGLLVEAGVKTPFWKPFDFRWAREILEVENLIPEDDIFNFSVTQKFKLIFKEKNHSRGEGIMFIDTISDLAAVIENGKEGYIEEVIDNYREFRVHVCGDEAFYVDEKLPREEGHTARIKNLANGYKYRNRSTSRPYPKEIKHESIKAVKALGIDFGAVDISVGVDGSINVFEVNSAPGLRTKTTKLYNEKLIEIIIKKGAEIINH